MATGSHLAVNLQELEMLKREMPQQMPAGVQRSTSLDSMPPPAQPAPIANNSGTDRLQQSQQPLAGIPELHNSLSSPPQACPVQRSRSLPLLDASQEIPAEILAQLTERENEQMMVADVGQHSLQQQPQQQQQQQPEAQEQQPAPQQTHQQHNLNNRISDSSSTCNSISISNVVTNSSNMNNVPFSDYVQASPYRILTQSQLQQATHLQENSQPLNLSQTAEVRQILSQGLPSHIPRVANFAGRQVGRDDLPLDWPSFQQAARYSIRPSEPRLGFPPSMLPPAIGQMPPFNPAFPGRGIDSYGVGTSTEGIRYSMPSAMNPNLQKPHMPMSVFARQHAFIKEEVGRQSPKDVTRVLQVPMDHVENNNDKSSPNIQAMSDGSTSNIAEKNMMPLSVSVSVAFSEPSQDSPSFSQQSNSPALLKPAADQTLSMINYHEDHLLSDTGLMSNSPVPSTLDENFLNSNMIISTNSAARLSDATNLTGLDSNPPSVKMEGFDLFEGSGDVDEQNYITDSISPQSLSMEDSNQGLPHGIQPGQGNPRPLSQTGISAAQSRGLDVAGPPQPGNNNGPLGDTPAAVASQPRSRKGRPKVTGAPGHRYQQPCPTCGKVFGSSSALAKHKLIHSNERRHKCILCAKSFKRQDHLTGHMLTHRSKKPYECAVDNCGKSYCDIRSLRRHFESQHPGLVMEDNMNYTGDEKDPELMAAEAAAVQANRHNQVMMRGSPGADFALAMGNPTDLNQSGSSQDTSDSPGSSSSAALQSLALAAQRVQNTPDPPMSQGQLSSQDMSTIYRLDSYSSQMFGGNLPNMSQSVLTGGVSGGMTTSLPGGGPRELSIQVPNPKFQGLSLSSGGVGLSGNGMLSHQSPGSNRFSNQSGPDLGISPKSSSNKSHRSHEKERITVECTVCKRTFKSMPALNGHMRLHGGYNNARAEVTQKVSPSKSEEKPPLPTALTHSQSRSLAHPSSMNPTMNTHSQLSQAQSSQAMGQHRPPLRMVGQSATPPTTMHLSSVYTNTTTSHVPSWPEYRHPRPHTVMSGGKPAYLSNLPNLSVNMLQDELTTLAHTAVGLAAQSQAMQKPPVQIAQPHHQPPQHHPLHHTTPLPMDRIQPVHPFNSRLPIGGKPLQMNNNQVNQIIPKEEPMPYPPSVSMGSPSPPKLESMYRNAQEQLIKSAEMLPTGHTTPPMLESKDENRIKDNVFRDPPPVLPTVTKKKPRPPSLFIPSWASNVTPGGIAPSTYPSQMRSPREIGVLYRSNSSTTPPPYTPPPMLSPIRSGSGLYFSVGSGNMPASGAAVAVTPKSAFPPSTPSMLQMHRRGSISASTEESDFAFPSEPHINVGCDYQAAVPELVKNKEEVLEAPDWREGKLVWDPAVEQEYSEGELTSFLKLATTPGLPAGARNIEYAHHCLYRAKGDIEMALLMLLNGNAMVPDEHVHMADYKYDFSQEWTVTERKLYRDMYKAKGKDFHEIAKGIPTKTVRDCVEYYYWWKKLYPYNHDMQKYCHHSGANPTEENRKNECDLYPGETFLDYVPLKEYRHDKYYRGGASNPKNNNTVKPSSTNQEDKPAAQQGPFVCNYPHCDASFKSRQALNGHIRVHGGSYKPNAATSNTTTNNQSRTTTSSSTTSSSYRGGGGVGQNTKQMPAESSSDEMSNEEEDEEEEEEEESEEGSSRDLTENEHDDDDDGMTSEDDQEPRFSCKICHKTFDKIKSRNAHMKSHHAADKKVEMGYGGGKEQQMFNHYMGHDSRSCSSSEEEDEEDDEEEDMEGDDDGLEDDEEMMSSEEDEDDDMSN